MRDLTKSLLSYSWAMSLFGARQLASLVDPRNLGGGGASLDAVTRAAKAQLEGLFADAFHAGDELQRRLVDTMFGVFDPRLWAAPGGAAASGVHGLDDGGDSALAFSGEGTLQFGQDGRIVFESKSGGDLRVVFDVSYLNEPENANRWYSWYDLPAQPFHDAWASNHTTSPTTVRAQAAATWGSSDGGSVGFSGPALLNLARYQEGPSVFLLSVAGNVAGGSGRYSGLLGGATFLGRGILPSGAPFAPGAELRCDAVATFRLVRQADVEFPSAAWNYQLQTIDVQGPGGKGFEMSYVEAGSGEPFVFLHGNPNWSYTWRNIFPHLVGLGCCYSPDLIGMGPGSKPEDASFGFQDHIQFIESFISRKGLRNITLVMHDWGSAIGFDYASRHPDNVRGLIFMEAVYKSYPQWSTFPEPDAPQFVRENFRLFREGYPSKDSFGYKAIVDQNIFIEVLTPSIMGRAVTQEEMEWTRLPYREKVNREVIWRWVNEIPIEGQPAAVARIVDGYIPWLVGTDLPKLLIYVVPGMIITSDSVRWLQQNLKNLVSVNVGPGLHYPHETNPYLVGTAMAEWYRNLPAVRTGSPAR